MRLGVVGLAARGEAAEGQPDPGLELGRAAGVQEHVVHAPVLGDDREAALGHDQQDGHVGAGGADQPAQVTRVRELLAPVDQEQVVVGRLEQGAALGREDLHLVAEQGQARQHLHGRLEGAGQQQQGAHGRSSGWVVGCVRISRMESTTTRADEDETGVIRVRLWAAAKATAGVAGLDLPVPGPLSLAEVVDLVLAGRPDRLAAGAGRLLGAGGRPAGVDARPGGRRGPSRRDGRVPAAVRGRLTPGRRNLRRPGAVGAHVTTGLWVLLGAVLAALAFGLYRAWADGRFRGTHPVRGVEPQPARPPPRPART